MNKKGNLTLGLLSSSQRKALDTVAEECFKRHYRAYLVGGAVRDLARGLRPKDLDLAIVGDAIGVGRALGRLRPEALFPKSKFNTCTVNVEGEYLDLAQARTETYSTPGALPSITPTDSIEDDLRRRDFSINALALSLNRDDYGSIVDIFGGQADLERGVIRVLHDASFTDDPTRALRAARFSVELGFSIEAGTLALLKRDLFYIDRVSGKRVTAELLKALEKPAAAQMFELFQELGILTALEPGFVLSSRLLHNLDVGVQTGGKVDELFTALLLELDTETVEKLSQRLALSKALRRNAKGVIKYSNEKIETKLVADEPVPALITRSLDNFAPALLDIYRKYASSSSVRASIGRYLDHYRHIKPSMSAYDLRELGVEDGAVLGRCLTLLRAALLNGEITDRAGEEEFVRKFVSDSDAVQG